MNNSGIVSYREKLEQVVDKHRDLLGDEAASLCTEHSIPTAQKLQADMAAIADEERLLRIGIVGRVKSGKSSLLNALIFAGQSILPKAATPMTAALTTLSYGDEEQAEVEFFTHEDMADMAAQAEEYERLLSQRVSELLEKEKSRMRNRGTSEEQRARIERRAARELRENQSVLAASHEQHAKIASSGISVGSLGDRKLLNLSGDLSGLQGQLAEYVGADGQYMPFTKSVNIRLPKENLKGIEIVDTPGINDPIQSREARTQEHLNQCDVVLVVSPAGQFITEQDVELMDRITSKEGIRELYVVAAQVDSQLFGSAKTQNDGQLDGVLDSIVEQLGGQLKKVIAKLQDDNPEVGDTYDQLLEGEGRVLHSSGLCASLRQRFTERDEWDEGMAHVWGNLQANYPDYFAAENAEINLGKLANLSAIQEKVEQVRARKEEILRGRIGDYEQDKRRSLQKLRTGLLRFVEQRQNEIEHTDLETIKQRRKALKKAFSNATEDVKLDYEESIEDVVRKLKANARGEIDKEADRLSGQLEGETKTESKSETIKVEKKGIGAKLARWLWGGGYEEKTRTYKTTTFTLRTGPVSSRLARFSGKLTGNLGSWVKDAEKEWQKDIIKRETKVLAEHFDDDQLDAAMIRRVIRGVVNSISVPEFKYEKSLPKTLRARGVLKEGKAEDFISEASSHLESLRTELGKEVSKYADELAKEMKKVRLDERLLKQFQTELASLEKSIENKEMEIERIRAIKGELTNMEEIL